MKKDISRRISGQDFYDLFKCKYCYGWWREGRYLYIGLTINGHARFGNHHVINKVIPLLPTDEFHFWYCQTEEGLKDLERDLIQEYNPPFNSVGKSTFKPCTPQLGQAVCLTCGLQFVQQRDWQKYCTVECREMASHKQLKPKKEKRAWWKDTELRECSCGVYFNTPINDPQLKCSNCI